MSWELSVQMSQIHQAEVKEFNIDEIIRRNRMMGRPGDRRIGEENSSLWPFNLVLSPVC